MSMQLSLMYTTVRYKHFLLSRNITVSIPHIPGAIMKNQGQPLLDQETVNFAIPQCGYIECSR